MKLHYKTGYTKDSKQKFLTGISKICLSVVFFLFSGKLLFSQSDWTQLNSGVSTTLNAITFVNSATGYAGGSNKVLLKTTNSGQTWFSSNTGLIQGNIFKIDFPSIDTGYALIDSLFYYKIFKTTDQGANWFTLPQGALVDIHFVNGITGYAAGYNVYKTTNGGQNWVNYPLENAYYTTAIYMINEFTGYVAGARSEHPSDRTSISLSANGVSWNISYTSTGHTNFKTGNFYDQGNGAFITSLPAGYLYRKRNGGNWVVENTSLNSIDYVTKDIVFGCGSAGLILKSFNGGDNWFTSQSSVIFNFSSICFVDTLLGYVCGDNGKILKTTNGGGLVAMQNSNSYLPEVFSLSQNYPNPFNPVTKIKFDISGISATQTFLFVYDLLGREVAVLVNKELQPGSYEVDWDASAYPSGVYYYKLESGSFIETKKMVLLK